MYPLFMFLERNKKNHIFLLLKIPIFTAVKYYSILHGHVCVMSRGFRFLVAIYILNFACCYFF